ncbi:MAG: hypothetical protein NC177_02970 [Ruminococcus flavefaciens]|nr:hypothetical protein [Ruminococcus flavefaciens]
MIDIIIAGAISGCDKISGGEPLSRNFKLKLHVFAKYLFKIVISKTLFDCLRITSTLIFGNTVFAVLADLFLMLGLVYICLSGFFYKNRMKALIFQRLRQLKNKILH